MDYLYGNLPEVVDPFAYEVIEKGDGTIKLQVDNDNRTISAQLIKTPGSLIIQKNKEGDTLSFNGNSDVKINIPEYIIESVRPDNGDIRKQYVLKKWNYETNQYDVVGDTIYLEEQIDELNIENGYVKEGLDTNTPHSTKFSLGNGGITSVQYKNDYKNLNIPTQKLPIKNEDGIFDDFDSQHKVDTLVGQKLGSIVGGATYTGIQSFAFGGQAVGLSDLSLVVLILQNNEQYIYYIESEKPLILKSVSNSQSAETIHQTTNNTIWFVLPDGTKVQQEFYLSWNSQSGKLQNISSPFNYPQVKIIRGYANPTSAIGNQSLSVGGGTEANYDWSQAFGVGTKTSTNNQMVIGSFNKEEPDALFIIGNGYYDLLTGTDVRSNALSIMRDGTVKIYNKDHEDSIITKGALDVEVGKINDNISLLDSKVEKYKQELDKEDGILQEYIDGLKLGLETETKNRENDVYELKQNLQHMSQEFNSQISDINSSIDNINVNLNDFKQTYTNQYNEVNATLIIHQQNIDSNAVSIKNINEKSLPAINSSISTITDNLSDVFTWNNDRGYVLDDGIITN